MSTVLTAMTTKRVTPAVAVIAGMFSVGCFGEEARLHGVVRAADGTPLSGELVEAPSSAAKGSARTDSDGSYIARFDLDGNDYRDLELHWNRARLLAMSAPDGPDINVPDLVDWPGELVITEDDQLRSVSWLPVSIAGRSLDYALMADEIELEQFSGTTTSASFDARELQDFASSISVTARSLASTDGSTPFYVETRSVAVELGGPVIPSSRGASCSVTPEFAVPASGCWLTDGPDGYEIAGIEQAVIDLGSIRAVEAVTVLELSMQGRGFGGPEGVVISLSVDGETFERAAYLSENVETYVTRFSPPTQARFVYIDRTWYASNEPMTYTVREIGVFP